MNYYSKDAEEISMQVAVALWVKVLYFKQTFRVHAVVARFASLIAYGVGVTLINKQKVQTLKGQQGTKRDHWGDYRTQTMQG